jgi:hypothetical protein
MAEVLGPLTLLNKALPTGVDGARLAEWAMRDGVTYGQLANNVALALGDANQAFVAKWGFLFSITEELAMEYPNGGAVTAMDELTDVDTPVAVHGSTIGHMLPLRYYGQGIGGTKRYFRDIRSAQVAAAIRTIVLKGIWRFEQKLLGRFFDSDEEAIGSAGYSVPFVHSTGGAVDFAPPSWDGTAFATTHDHFIGYNLSTPKTMADVLNGLAATLAEHGHVAPYTALVSRADIALFSALTKFVELVSNVISVIDRGGGTTGPQFYSNGDRDLGRVGYFQSEVGLVELVASNRIPTAYVGMTKSYGQLDARNALAVRVHPARGFGLAVVPETTPDDDFPIKQLDVDFEFGVGVGMDRTNGAVGYLVAGGSYSDATIN